MERSPDAVGVIELGLWRLAHRDECDIDEGNRLPAFGDGSERGVDEGSALADEVQEMDAPLPVDHPRHLHKHLHSSAVVLSTFIQDAQHCCTLVLSRPAGQAYT